MVGVGGAAGAWVIVVAMVYRVVVESESRCVEDEVEKAGEVKRAKSKAKGYVQRPT